MPCLLSARGDGDADCAKLDDDVTSLSRLCRTSRSLYYMTLPHLWKSVTLTSHTSIRYKDGEAEGSGGASPFAMGLNALVTSKIASLVRNLTLQGDFGGTENQEYSRAGRVSETGMILNIAICAALDRCPQLESFRWVSPSLPLRCNTVQKEAG